MADLYGIKTGETSMYSRFYIRLTNSAEAGGTLYDPTTTWYRKLGQDTSGALVMRYSCDANLVLPADCRGLFSGAQADEGSKTNISNFSTIDTSNVENMSCMFYRAEIRYLTFNHFNTSKVTDMSRMFYHYSHYLNVSGGYDVATDLSNGDTSKVTTMEEMFCGAVSPSPLGINNGDISNVDKFTRMFASGSFGTNETNLEHGGIYAGDNVDGSRQAKATAISTGMGQGARATYRGAAQKVGKSPYTIDVIANNIIGTGIFGGNGPGFGNKYNAMYYDSEFNNYELFEKVEDEWQQADVYVKYGG